MRNRQIKNIAFAGIIIGLIILMSFTNIGFIPVAGTSITIIHIPVLVGALVLGKKHGALLGLIFGLCSLIMAFVRIATDAPFTNPLVSVFPRVLLGFLVVPLYTLFKKLFKNEILSTSLTMIISTIIHSLMVLTIMFIVWRTNFYFGVADYTAQFGDGTGSNLFSIIFAVLMSNGIIEIILAGVVGTPIIIALKTLFKENEIKEN